MNIFIFKKFMGEIPSYVASDPHIHTAWYVSRLRSVTNGVASIG
jgi:hypothetical protein